MTLKEQIMKLQTYKMYEGEDTVYVERDDVLKALEQQLRDCKTCKHSDKGNCAYTEECHECMWGSKYEQQPCEDVEEYGMNEQMESSSEKPNKSENPTSWIPVSERLPKENEYIGNVCKYYLIQDEYGDMHVAHLTNDGWIPMESLRAISSEITAWRELPEPYKAESEDMK